MRPEPVTPSIETDLSEEERRAETDRKMLKIEAELAKKTGKDGSTLPAEGWRQDDNGVLLFWI